jgi:hypothetical protein
MHMDDHITSVYLGKWKKESSGSIAAALGQVAEAPVLVHATGRCPQPGPAGSRSGQHVCPGFGIV